MPRRAEDGVNATTFVENTSWKKRLQTRDGTLTSDAEVIREMAADYYAKLYSARYGDLPPKWWNKRWSRADVAGSLKKLTPFRVRELTMKLKAGKTCSKSDRITAEMLQTLPEEAFDILCELFILRIINHPDADDDGAFSSYEISLLQKVLNPTNMREWRPIAVMSVLSKLYSMALADVGELDSVELLENQFAFRKG